MDRSASTSGARQVTAKSESKARLALAPLMYTGVRRSDVVRLGPPMELGGALSFVTHKGRNADEPVEVTMPVIPELRAIIDATPVVGVTTYIVTEFGRPFTAAGFGNKMADWCKAAGIEGKNSHGVRKAAARRAAERGATTHALMAMFGWLDIKQAERYTRDASRKRLARENAHLLGSDSGTEGDQDFPHFGCGWEPSKKESRKKVRRING